MRGAVCCLLVWLGLVTSPVLCAEDDLQAAKADPVLEARLQKLAEELRCLVCQNESLAASRADLALDLRREMRTQMRAGKSDREVIDYLVSRYGDFIRYRPPLRADTLLLWFAPAAVLLIAGAALWQSLRRRLATAPAADLSAEDEARANALLGERREP